jgi:hypothetical protein
MNTLLDVRPIQKSGFLACAARNACSCDEAIVPEAGIRSYLTSQPCFVRSVTAILAPSSKFGTACDDSPFVSYAPMTYSVFFPLVLDWAPAGPVTTAPATIAAVATHVTAAILSLLKAVHPLVVLAGSFPPSN